MYRTSGIRPPFLEEAGGVDTICVFPHNSPTACKLDPLGLFLEVLYLLEVNFSFYYLLYLVVAGFSDV